MRDSLIFEVVVPRLPSIIDRIYLPSDEYFTLHILHEDFIRVNSLTIQNMDFGI